MWVSVDEMTHLTVEDTLTLNECFKLAHNEQNHRRIDDDKLKERALDLFHIRKLIEINITYADDYPVKNKGGE